MTALRCYERHTAELNDLVVPDGWDSGTRLEEGDAYVDSDYVGCDFRLPSGRYIDVSFAVNIKVTGNLHLAGTEERVGRGYWKSRCQIEFVQDGEPSIYSGGWIYTNNLPMDKE